MARLPGKRPSRKPRVDTQRVDPTRDDVEQRRGVLDAFFAAKVLPEKKTLGCGSNPCRTRYLLFNQDGTTRTGTLLFHQDGTTRTVLFHQDGTRRSSTMSIKKLLLLPSRLLMFLVEEDPTSLDRACSRSRSG